MSSLSFLAVTASDVASWTALAVAVIGAVFAGYINVLKTKADLAKAQAIAKNGQDITQLQAVHASNAQAIDTLGAAVATVAANVPNAIPVRLPPAQAPASLLPNSPAVVSHWNPPAGLNIPAPTKLP